MSTTVKKTPRCRSRKDKEFEMLLRRAARLLTSQQKKGRGRVFGRFDHKPKPLNHGDVESRVRGGLSKK